MSSSKDKYPTYERDGYEYLSKMPPRKEDSSSNRHPRSQDRSQSKDYQAYKEQLEKKYKK
jgi:hypothetical protein